MSNSEPLEDSTGPLHTTTHQMVAMRLKSANKYIFRAMLSLGSANLLIRVGGMLNQVVVTARFGQGAEMDAYFVAATIPILLAQLLISDLEASVIPIFVRIRLKGTREQASILFSTLLNILFLGLGALTVLMFIFRSQIIIFSAPALDSVRGQLATNLAPFIFPVLLIMVMNSFLECLLNSEGQFGWPAYAGLLVPLTTAAVVLFAGKSQGVVMLCIGTLIGQLLQLFAIILRVRRSKLVYRPFIDWRNPGLIAIGVVAWPALFGTLISQAAPLVDQMFASSLSVGNIAALNNALKLVSVPVGVIFASAGRAALPYLARQAEMKDMKAFKETLRLYLWAIGIVTIVLTAFMILLAHPIVQILFQRGEFTPADTSRTTTILIGFLIGLTPMAFGFIVSRAFSALGKTRLLMYTTVFSVLANALFDYIFARLWQGFGIALATSAVYFCTMFILLFALRSLIGKLDLLTPPGEVYKVILKMGLGPYYMRWRAWKEENLSSFSVSFKLRNQILRIGIMLAVFAAGAAGVISNYLYTFRLAFGSLIVLAFLRYRYILLIVWALINALISSTLPIFSGSNFLSGLTAPTILLLFYLPVKQAFKRMPAIALFFIYLLWILLGISLSPLGVSQFLSIWTVYLDYVGVAVLTIVVITSKQRLLRLIDAILLPSLFIGLYGIYGYITKQHGEVDPSTQLFRTASIFGTGAQTFATFLSIIIPLAVYRTFTLQGFKRIAGLILTLILLTSLGLTFTRGALLCVPASIIIMIMFLPSRKVKISLLTVGAAIASLTVIVGLETNNPIFKRFLNQDVTTLNGRTYLWQATLDHFDPTRLLGYGLKASDALLISLRVGFGGQVIDNATHNIFLEALYDTGTIGLLLLVLTLLTLAITIIIKMRKTSPDHRMMLATALAIFFSMMVQSFESNDIWTQSIGPYFWISMALPFALCWATPESSLESQDVEVLPDTVEPLDDVEFLDTVKLPNTVEFLDTVKLPDVKILPNTVEFLDTVKLPDAKVLLDTVELPDQEELPDQDETIPRMKAILQTEQEKDSSHV